MTLRINLGQSEVELKILKNGRTIDMGSVKYYHDLSEVLITGLDKLLRRNKIDPVRHFRHNWGKRGKKAMSNGVDATVLKSFKIKENLGQDSTSYKIASAFVEGLKI